MEPPENFLKWKRVKNFDKRIKNKIIQIKEFGYYNEMFVHKAFKNKNKFETQLGAGCGSYDIKKIKVKIAKKDYTKIKGTKFVLTWACHVNNETGIKICKKKDIIREIKENIKNSREIIKDWKNDSSESQKHIYEGMKNIFKKTKKIIKKDKGANKIIKQYLRDEQELVSLEGKHELEHELTTRFEQLVKIKNGIIIKKYK